METMEDSITWSWWKLAAAEPLDLFAYLRLRSDVFVVEQDCTYRDMDDHDLVAWHVTGTDASGRLLAVARLLPPDAKYAEPSLGRVIVTRAARGTGAGHRLVDEALRKAATEYPGYGHRIQAQAYLERFYGSHGFEPEGEVYLEDGIPHIDMTLTSGRGLLGYEPCGGSGGVIVRPWARA
jgi:ElaA protein